MLGKTDEQNVENFQSEFDLESTWVPYLMRFEWLESSALGWMTTADAAEIVTLEFRTTTSSFELSVDDIGFY